MRTFDLRPFRRDKSYSMALEGVRLVIAGTENGSTGYGVGYVPTGSKGRQVHAGPEVPGPWGYTFGLATVVSIWGGTGADKAREEAEGRLVNAVAGDRLILDDDLTVEVSVDRRRYPHLTPVEG
jgi:hypothetical protein